MCKYFWFLGAFLAKTLQDNRLVDLPLAYPFLKLLCGGEVSSVVREKSRIVHQQTTQDDELMASSMYSILSEESDLDTSGGGGNNSSAWFAHMLTLEDLVQVKSPPRAHYHRAHLA